uniref:Putative glycoside hydrolase, family 28, Pectin lyase fold/virulence factor n=1 Tax=Helianthus annuus TaxID=4232 RepID=A0A251SRU4_HELAN
MAFTGKGFLVVVLFGFSYLLFSLEIASAATFDVTSYGAKGDGSTDDSQAFLQAWADLCGDDSTYPTLIIPSGMTFLISPLTFDGSSCKSLNINIKLLGTITAPNTLDGWKDCVHRQFWIVFVAVKGLTIDGPGRFDGQGSTWWRIKAIHFNGCPGLRLKGTTHINSPFLHISIKECQDVDIGNLQIKAPGNSPNTDGIDISDSSHVNIHDSNIQTGDDCVAINGGVVDINVTNVWCGPGHGISIGSLGENGGHDTVEQVLVQNCNITGTSNGLRIKTVPNGTGYAKGIRFQDINLVNVQNPIIIDQYYCTHSGNVVCPPQSSTKAVQVSDVTYTNIYGSSASKFGIVFNCSEIYKCTNIVVNNVHITGDADLDTGGEDLAYCKNVQGEFVDTTPSVSCY